MSYTTSPNMNLPIPTVGSESGPTYAYDINTSLSLIDQHDHNQAAGRGIYITPSGLNINATLPFNNQLASGLQAAIFTDQASLATLNALYTVGSELYYNDASGAVQITLNGSVNATSSSLTSASASASFSAGVLDVWSVTSTSTPGNVQCGSVLLGNNTAGSNFLTLQPPSLTGGSYSLTLPTIPASTKFITIDNTGVLGTASSISAAQIASGSITGSQLANQTITVTQIAAATITGAKIASSTITGSNIASSTVAILNMATVSNTSATGSSYSNGGGFSTVVSESFTSTQASQRPVFFSFSGGGFTITDSGSGFSALFKIVNLTDSVTAASWSVPIPPSGVVGLSSGSFNWCGVVSGASSTRTYALQASISGAAGSTIVSTGVTMNIIQV